MRSHPCSIWRRAFIGAALAFALAAPAAAAAAPLPRAKPVIVYLERAPLPAPAIGAPAAAKPEDAEASRLRGVEALLWEIYRLIWLLAAIALGVVALSLWHGFAAREAARRQLRAYVSVRPGAAPRLDADWTDATVVVENNGTTPAFALDHAATLMMLDYPELPLASVMGAAEKLFGRKSVVLAPGMEITLPLRTVLSEDEKHETEDGTHKRLAAIGEVRYADAFGKRHFTRFCFLYGGAAAIGRGEMDFADMGNEAS